MNASIEIKPMIKLTNSKDCTVDSNNTDVYLSWNDMVWTVSGNVRSYFEPRGTMCKYHEGISTIYLSGKKIIDI